MSRRSFPVLIVLILACLLTVAGCVPVPAAAPAAAPSPAAPAAAEPPAGEQIAAPATQANVLRLATTTSTQDSGLLDAILPTFEQTNNCKVDVVAVGTGQAIEIGRKGDADVLLVHARKQEDQFVQDGQATTRYDVMYNDFIIVGPQADPAKIGAMTSATDALKALAASEATFVSRGDKSGTNTKELSIWASTGITPTKDMKWYNAIGQGMGDTLLFADQQNGYTLSDRGTYLSMRDKLPHLTILVGGQQLAENKDKNLLNPYGVMAVNPAKHPGVNAALAQKFIDWLLSPATQQVIGAYGQDKFDQPLFYPGVFGK
jgi:tungstate transport system substrate-binding protein